LRRLWETTIILKNWGDSGKNRGIKPRGIDGTAELGPRN